MRIFAKFLSSVYVPTPFQSFRISKIYHKTKFHSCCGQIVCNLIYMRLGNNRYSFELNYDFPKTYKVCKIHFFEGLAFVHYS